MSIHFADRMRGGVGPRLLVSIGFSIVALLAVVGRVITLIGAPYFTRNTENDRFQ